MNRTIFCSVAFICLLSAGCGDDNTRGIPARATASPSDAGAPDASVADANTFGACVCPLWGGCVYFNDCLYGWSKDNCEQRSCAINPWGSLPDSGSYREARCEWITAGSADASTQTTSTCQ